MAPVKFEEDIKSKLEERTIEPSEKAWAKLSGRLDEDEGSGKNRFWLLSVAAGFLLILFTVIQVMRSPEEINTEDSYAVEETKDIVVSDESVTDNTPQVAMDNELIQTVAETEEVHKSESQSTVVTRKTSTYMAQNKEESSDQRVTIDELPRATENTEITEAVVSNDLDESLIREVLQDSRASGQDQLDRETDSLLKAAQKELLMDKAMMEHTTIVQANELLMEVEEEVEPSLKSRVYEVIKDGYKKVKTVVAQRNN